MVDTLGLLKDLDRNNKMKEALRHLHSLLLKEEHKLPHADVIQSYINGSW
jgi:hypothetical protein